MVEAGCILGEGPVWDVESARLWWVDIKAPALHRFDPRKNAADRWAAPEPVGALALRRGGGLLLALRSGFAFYDPDHGRMAHLASPEADQPGNRMNDGKCDAMGRFWAGTMDNAVQRPTGHLYRLDPDHRVTAFPMGFVVTNGMAWSGDGATLYFTDTVAGTIWAYAFDMAKGRPGERRLFAQVPEADGRPDGGCVDAEDHLWSCHWGGSRITRYRPDGEIDRVVELPVPQVTSCCFGGPGLDVLYVTTAHEGMSAQTRAAHPQSGHLFAVKGLGVRGRPMPRFAG